MSTSDGNSIYVARQNKLALALQTAGMDAVALNAGPSLTYLTGLHFHLSERPVVVFFIPHSLPVIVLPELEAGKTQALPFALQAVPYGEDPTKWIAAFRHALTATRLPGQARIGVEPERLRYLEMNMLMQSAPGLEFVSAAEELSGLRLRKDGNEIAAMRRAVEIAQNAMLATLDHARAGMSERELAAELTLQLLRGGSQPDLPFSPIVASGPNGANPHASLSDRILQPGDLVVIDWGARYGDYVSDITRTYAIGEVDAQARRVYELVREANRAGRNSAGPEIPAGHVDDATRAVIEKAGYGQYFIHRTGHGIGLDGHEPPYIRAGNHQRLEEGMTFTVEPGIYIPGRYGVRIEDNVVITSQGAESLTDLPRDLRAIA